MYTENSMREMGERKRDARWERSRRKIVRALLGILDREQYALTVRPSRVYRAAKVGRSTFRRHYRVVNEILEQEDAVLMKKFDKILNGVDSDMVMWRKVLILMAKNREVLLVRLRQRDDRVFRTMIEKINRQRDFGWQRYDVGVRSEIFEMFYSEAVGTINIWVKKKMSIEMVPKIARRLEHLATTADKRWRQVVTDEF